MITIKPGSSDPNRWLFDFDVAALGGRGGANILLDPSRGMVSINGVHKNRLLPRRSTAKLVAHGLSVIGLSKPVILEAYHVERTTAAALFAGDDGSDTLLGKFLLRLAMEIGGTVGRWEPIPLGYGFHLWAHVTYP